jgi:hypothetical protein
MLIRSTFSAIAVAALAFALAPLACGGAQEEYPHAPQSQEDTSASATNEWVTPEAVVQTMRGCVKEHASELKTYSHETKFDLTVNEDGAVHGVKLHSSTLHHAAIESCLSKALAGLSIPPSMFPMRSSPSSQPFSGGESMRETRAPLGIAQVAGPIIVFGPLILIAAGVTLGVYVAVVVTEETIEAVKRSRRIDQACDPQYQACNMNPDQPDWNIGNFGKQKSCLFCLWECRKDQGVWPNYKCPPLGYRPN